jgi:hypothetical protein
MSQRRIKVTLYIVMELYDKKTRAFLRETYSEAGFYFTLPNAPDDTDPAELVTDRMIHERLNEFFEKPELLSQLKVQYPTLPDFYINKGRMATQKVFFEDM